MKISEDSCDFADRDNKAGQQECDNGIDLLYISLLGPFIHSLLSCSTCMKYLCVSWAFLLVMCYT